MSQKIKVGIYDIDGVVHIESVGINKIAYADTLTLRLPNGDDFSLKCNNDGSLKITSGGHRMNVANIQYDEITLRQEILT